MTGLCGWFDASGSALANGPIDAMAAELARFNGTCVRKESSAWGAVAASGKDSDVSVLRDNDQLIAIWGRVRFAETRLADVAERHGAARAFAMGHDAQGLKILTALRGSFAVAMLSRDSGKALLAVDRIGAHTLSYATCGNKLAFGSTLDAIGACSGVSREVNAQGIYDYVHFHMVPSPQTIYAGYQRLLPGTALLWHKTQAQTLPYWQLRFTENGSESLADLQQEFLRLLRSSMAESVVDGRTGAFLSGGTDSSTITGMLREVTGAAPRTYSIGFDAQGFDEMHYARLTARHFGAQHHEYYVTPDDVVSAIPRIAAVHDQPFGNASAVPTYYCARLARDDGIDLMLAGDGGDELFGGNARYGTQYLYALYGELPQALRKAVIEPVVSRLPETGITGKAQRYIATASMPMPARYDNYNLLDRLGPSNVFCPDFLSAVDPGLPMTRVEAAYESVDAQSWINRMLALDLKYTLADNDLPKVLRSCELAELSVRFPLLQEELVAFAARLRPQLKVRRTELRYFFKRALRHFLPRETIKKSKHGFGLPVGPWLQSYQPLRQMAFDSLADLKRRRIVRPEFIDQLAGDYLDRHANYYGTMVWVLMMLEQWIKQHKASI